MRTAIISDIHSNLEALTAVLSTIDVMKPDGIICLGDIVGYGANPAECIDMIRIRNIPTICGNHDLGVAGRLEEERFSEAARRGLEWSRSRLSDEHLEFLRSLPITIDHPEAKMVHSSPDAPTEFRYLLQPFDAAESYDHFSQYLCFVGHTHRPVIFSHAGVEHRIIKDRQYIVNAGSVGQPRDGDWRGCFALFDSERWSVDHIRVEYDNNQARQKIIDAGLPQKLGDRLMVGV
jgi:diadenosine tetraphosphatase ApaH/serine/threonine PP2A family protein phosphatase